MNTLLVQGAGIPRAEMQCYDPDDDGEATPVETVVPWDPDGGDDDRRRFEGEELLFLNQDEWDLIDDMIAWRVPLTGIGSRCAHIAGDIRSLKWGVAGPNQDLPVYFRPPPATGGTFIIFPGE